jgi:hypothetical protein
VKRIVVSGVLALWYAVLGASSALADSLPPPLVPDIPHTAMVLWVGSAFVVLVSGMSLALVLRLVRNRPAP